MIQCISYIYIYLIIFLYYIIDTVNVGFPWSLAVDIAKHMLRDVVDHHHVFDLAHRQIRDNWDPGVIMAMKNPPFIDI